MGIRRIYMISCDICSHWHEFQSAAVCSVGEVERLAPRYGFISVPRNKLAVDAITRVGYKVPRQTPRVWLCHPCVGQYLRYPANVQASDKIEDARAEVEAKIPKVSLSEVSRRMHEQQDAR